MTVRIEPGISKLTAVRSVISRVVRSNRQRIAFDLQASMRPQERSSKGHKDRGVVRKRARVLVSRYVVGMLKRWMSERAYGGFLDCRGRGLPFADVGVVPPGALGFGWGTLDRVLADGSADVLVVRESEWLAEAQPTSAEGVRALFVRGAGIVVRRAERHDAELALLADSFARELSGSAHVQLFVTPGKTQGFGWHYDEEDVCILQTHGVKTYYFRQNTQEVVPGRFDFAAVRRETSPLMSCTLWALDLLYLPRFMWHAAKADEDSLSISIGVR